VRGRDGRENGDVADNRTEIENVTRYGEYRVTSLSDHLLEHYQILGAITGRSMFTPVFTRDFHR
jgi:hypothetical protein